MSKNNNNGKVLNEYLSSFKDDELCQFYTAKETEATSFPTLNITDLDVLNKYKIISTKSKNPANGAITSRQNIRKTPFKQLVRYFLWNFSWSTNRRICSF